MSSPARRAQLRAEDEARGKQREIDERAAWDRRLTLIAGIRAEIDNSNIETVLADILLDSEAFIRMNT